ncbi:MAG: (2Fe-2S) ferredoxin domain-containing protein, partial [Deltaproteobacteria bacterium]|nr:(2Fe-2S) ferredoxin domain-containing protein [Deltaproteobacteria bacterium]
MTRLNIISDLENERDRLRQTRKNIRATLTLCGGTGCQASQCQSVVDAVKEELKEHGLENSVHVRVTGCHGFCEQGPIVVFEPGNIFYCHVLPEDCHEIVSKTACNGDVIERLLYTDPVSGKKIQTESEIPFYRAQDRQLLAHNRQIDPCS